jgi:hypothetical protein
MSINFIWPDVRPKLRKNLSSGLAKLYLGKSCYEPDSTLMQSAVGGLHPDVPNASDSCSVILIPSG